MRFAGKDEIPPTILRFRHRCCRDSNLWIKKKAAALRAVLPSLFAPTPRWLAAYSNSRFYSFPTVPSIKFHPLWRPRLAFAAGSAAVRHKAAALPAASLPRSDLMRSDDPATKSQVRRRPRKALKKPSILFHCRFPIQDSTDIHR